MSLVGAVVSSEASGGLAGTVLQVGVPSYLEETIASLVAYVPRIVAALIILVIGWFIARGAGRLVAGLTDRVELDRLVVETPLGQLLGGTEKSVSSAFGTLTRWFVYAITIMVAADALSVPVFTVWIATAVSYIPAFLAGLLVIVVGFIIADFIGDVIMRTRAATETAYTSWFATGTRLFLYFTAVVIGLDTMGIEVAILFVFAQAIAWGFAAAIAIGVGIAVGWGGKDYVANNIDRWTGRLGTASSPHADGGEVSGGTESPE